VQCILQQLVDANDNMPTFQTDCEVTSFHAARAPAITVARYLERVIRYASCSTECYILALIYIDRLIQLHQLPEATQRFGWDAVAVQP
jgi:hypothetical protein